PAATFGSPTAAQPWLINGFTIYTRTVPEPSTVALGIAGAIVLWLYRRRNGHELAPTPAKRMVAAKRGIVKATGTWHAEKAVIRTMKSLATLVVATIALSESARGQGTIDFHNPNTFPLRFSDGTTTTIVGAPGCPLGPASVRVGLFIGASTATSISQMTMVGLTTNSASTLPIFLGTFNGGIPYTVAGHAQYEVVSFA